MLIFVLDLVFKIGLGIVGISVGIGVLGLFYGLKHNRIEEYSWLKVAFIIELIGLVVTTIPIVWCLL